MIGILVLFAMLSSRLSCEPGFDDTELVEVVFMKSAKASCSPTADLAACNLKRSRLQKAPKVFRLQSMEGEYRKSVLALEFRGIKARELNDSLWEIRDSTKATQRKIAEKRLSVLQGKALSWMAVVASLGMLLLSLSVKLPQREMEAPQDGKDWLASVRQRLWAGISGIKRFAFVLYDLSRNGKLDVLLLAISFPAIVVCLFVKQQESLPFMLCAGLLALIVVVRILLLAGVYAYWERDKVKWNALRLVSTLSVLLVSPILSLGGRLEKAFAVSVIGLLVYVVLASKGRVRERMDRNPVAIGFMNAAVVVLVSVAIRIYQTLVSYEECYEFPKMKILAAFAAYGVSFLFLSRPWRKFSRLEKLICLFALLVFGAQMLLSSFPGMGIPLARICGDLWGWLPFIPMYGAMIHVFAYFKSFQDEME